MSPGESREARKGRGAFFTPPAVARFLTDWAVRSASDRILEPSCGKASFLLESGRRLRDLGGLVTREQLFAPPLRTLGDANDRGSW